MRQSLPDLNISSAGLGALVGHDVEATARSVAEEKGLSFPLHQARQLTSALCREADLILVMESGHREAVTAMCPEARGKVFLLGQGMQTPNIADPYRKGRQAFEVAFNQIEAASAAWTKRLSPQARKQAV